MVEKNEIVELTRPSHRFMFLSYNFNYASRVLSIATKVTINQIVFAPVFNTYFFGMQALLAGESLEETWVRIQRTVPTSMVEFGQASGSAVTAFSFAFVPLEFRSVFAGAIAVGWQTYLSFLNRTAEDEERAIKTGVKVQELVGKLEGSMISIRIGRFISGGGGFGLLRRLDMH